VVFLDGLTERYVAVFENPQIPIQERNETNQKGLKVLEIKINFVLFFSSTRLKAWTK